MGALPASPTDGGGERSYTSQFERSYRASPRASAFVMVMFRSMFVVIGGGRRHLSSREGIIINDSVVLLV